MPTAQQVAEAERLIAQKLAADAKRPKLRLVEKRKLPEAALEYWRGVGETSLPSREERQRQRRQEWAAKMLEPAGGFKVPERYKHYTPDTLQKLIGKKKYNSEKKEAVDIAAVWADGKLEKPSLLIWGDPGTGKTALAICAMRYRAAQTGESKLLIRYGAFVNAVQATYNGSNRQGPTKQQLLRAVQIADLLLVDDFGENALGLAAASNDKQNIMREILDYRNMNDLPTVIISNLTPARLQAQFKEDIISRLQEMALLIEMGGTDLREKGAVGWSN